MIKKKLIFNYLSKENNNVGNKPKPLGSGASLLPDNIRNNFKDIHSKVENAINSKSDKKDLGLILIDYQLD